MGDHFEHSVKHVDTELMFWRASGGDNRVQIDFTNGNPKEGVKAMRVHDQMHRVRVHDIRGQESNFTLDKNGFVYVSHDMPGDATDEEQVKNTIIPKTEELVRQITGATRTVTFAHRVRCLATDASLLADNRAPAHNVHSDFTAEGALHHLESIIPDEQERTRLLAGRVLIINVWRPLKTIQRDPLAVCDWNSVKPRDSIPTRLILPHGWNELARYAFSANQQWYYLGRQQPHEPLVFTQFDSDKGVSVPHSAFVDPEFQDGAARESIEIKMFAFL